MSSSNEMNISPPEGKAEEMAALHAYQQERHEQFARWSLDYSEELEELERNLKNQRWSATENKFITMGKARINDEGVAEVLSIVQPYITKNFQLSDFDDEEINTLMFEVSGEIDDQLFFNRNAWDIKGEDMGWISMIVRHSVFASLKRARHGATLKSIKTQLREIETFSHVEQGEKKGGLFRNPFKKQDA